MREHDLAPPNVEPSAEPADELQFRKAEFSEAGRCCAVCQVPIADTYYLCRDKAVCQNCAAQRPELQPPSGAVHFSRCVLYGLGAAIAGSVLFAAVSLATGYQFSLLSIVVGIVVGKAIRRAAGGRGGLKYQVLAVLLTYGAITTSFVPVLLKEARASQKIAGKQTDPAAAQEAQNRAKRTPSLGRASLAVALLIGVGLISPFLMLMSSPAGGLLNALIIGFGLMQAWRQTRGVNVVLAGPYRAGST